MGVKGVDPSHLSGDYVEPKDWNRILDDPNTLVIDTRNEYEISVGTFSGSINPHTNSFRDFPLWVDSYLRSFVTERKIENIAMFCTGGIRCEKASSYLLQEGFEQPQYQKPRICQKHG